MSITGLFLIGTILIGVGGSFALYIEARQDIKDYLETERKIKRIYNEADWEFLKTL